MDIKQFLQIFLFFPLIVLGQIVQEKNIENVLSDGDIIFSSPIIFNNSKSTNICITSLDTNKFVVAWQDDLSGGKGYSRVGEVVGNNITFGEIEVFDPGVVGEISIKKLDPYKFIICWQDNKNGSIGKAIIGEVNYNIISYDNSYIFNDTITENISLTALDYYRCVLSFSDGGDSFHSKSLKANVVGNYVTFGPKVTFSISLASEINSFRLTDSTFSVVYTDTGNIPSNIIHGKVYSDSVSYGIGMEFYLETTEEIDAVDLFDNKFVLSYISNGIAKTLAGSFFNDRFSFGLPQIVAQTNPDEHLISAIDQNHIVSISKFPDNSFQGTYVTINGTVQHQYSNTSISSGFSSLSISKLNEEKFVVACYDISGGGSGKLIMGSIIKPEGYFLNAKVFLEGPFNGLEMNTDLYPQHLPSLQGYSGTPWDYQGTEYLSNFPDKVVDWIYFELRETVGGASTATSDKMINRQSAIIENTGNLLSSDGLSRPYFEVEIIEELYLVIDHRNHLKIMSAFPLNGLNGVYYYDFSNSIDNVYQGNVGYKYLSEGVCGMLSGDADANSQIQNMDKNDIWFFENGMTGYFSGDFNMDGISDIIDYNNYWLQNAGIGSQVPE